jgi:transposase InsO family protein
VNPESETKSEVLMKLSSKMKSAIYDLWKTNKYSYNDIAIFFSLDHKEVSFCIKLIEKHGIEVLSKKKELYSPAVKETAVKRVIENGESIEMVSIDMGIVGRGSLSKWIKEYRKDCYTTIKKWSIAYEKRLSGKSLCPAKNCATPAEYINGFLGEYCVKKIISLNSKTENLSIQQLVQAITELRQETKESLDLILECINSIPNVPQISRSKYYRVTSRTEKDNKNDSLMNEIISIFYENNGWYGYRRITLELNKRGFVVNHKKVKRLMRKMGLYGKTRKRKSNRYNSYKGTVGKIAENLVKRDFFATKPNEKVYADISQFNFEDKKIYLHAMRDGFAGDIISYDISFSPSLAQTIKVLNTAVIQYPALKGAIFYTDQGWQYQHYNVQTLLRNNGIKQSMSKKGNCLDNAFMENFFGLMKTEMFYGEEETFSSLEEFIQAMNDYIAYFNSKRIQVKLGGLTPLEYRNQYSMH